MPSAPARSSPATAARRRLLRRGMLLEGLTIGYNIAEAIIAITAGIFAGSVALVGFGFDSIIEVIAATVVGHRLLAETRGSSVQEAA
ncbi:MAG: cation transporter, partial [Acidobacteria bacterium]|nr:cation transporter [Acidobacteriota bacterium]